ncbi:hypothetical protein LZ30DRAFT_403067 [Colletotrichum cereale]|nr:hypothetical protein LZ30DRAFT_403067 [Colletotrichum cereale]
MPLYEYILSDNPSAHVQMVWAIKRPGEAAWSVLRSGGKAHSDGRIRLFHTCRGRETPSTAIDSSRFLLIEKFRRLDSQSIVLFQ